MNRVSRKILILSLVFLLLSSLPFPVSASIKAPPSDRAFSLELFRKTAANHAAGNVLISPLSVDLALSMVSNGSSGKNREQMARVLGVAANKLDKMNARNKSIIQSLRANKQVTLEIANAVFANKTTPFNPEFINLTRSVYSAEARNLDFKNSTETLNAINGWCSSKTHGKIPSILSDISDKELMVLLNAIYFKGSWAEKFQKEQTKSEDFSLESGAKTKVKMMHRRGNILYFHGDNFAAVSLPYVGEKQSMYIFLPDKGVSMTAFQAKFTEKNWNAWMSSIAENGASEVILSLPKFTIDSEESMGETLKAMGMKLAFEVGIPGTFEKLVPPDYRAWISRVIHKTFMDVSEEGTEAAAVTAVTMGIMAPCPRPTPPPPIEFKVNHPFVLALVDNSTGEIMFLGKILKP